MRWWHLVDIPSNNLLPALSPGTEQSHFSLHKHSCSAYSPLQAGSSSCYWWHLTTKKANIWSEHIGQKHQINVSHWLDRTKAITSLHLSDEQQHKKKSTGGLAYHTLCEAYFCGQALCQVVKAAMMEGVWLSSPSGRIMSSERDTGVTNRNMSYSTSYGKVGAKQTAVLPFLFECLIL